MFAAAVKKLAGMTERLPFMAFVSDEITRAVVVKVAEQQGWKDPVIYEGGIIDAIRELADIKTPRTLVIDLTNVDDPMTEIGNLADVCEPNTKVITIGAINDVNLYRELVDLGVQDYLVKPVAVESLAGAVTKALHEPKVEETEPRKIQQTIAVSRIASSTSISISCTDSSMNCVESKLTPRRIPSGSVAPSAATFARTSRATATAFAPRCFLMPSPWAGSPLTRE